MAFTFKNAYLQGVYDSVVKRNGNEPEFLQAVGEVLMSLEPVVEKVFGKYVHGCEIFVT